MPPLLLVATLHNELVGGVLALAGLVTQSGLAPGSHRAGTADGRAALAAAVIVAMIVLLVRNSHRKLLSLSLTLIAAGALGNMIDRTVYGYVVDFLDFYWQGWHWPAFNVADVAICGGAFFLIVDELRSGRR